MSPRVRAPPFPVDAIHSRQPPTVLALMKRRRREYAARETCTSPLRSILSRFSETGHSPEAASRFVRDVIGNPKGGEPLVCHPKGRLASGSVSFIHLRLESISPELTDGRPCVDRSGSVVPIRKNDKGTKRLGELALVVRDAVFKPPENLRTRPALICRAQGLQMSRREASFASTRGSGFWRQHHPECPH